MPPIFFKEASFSEINPSDVVKNIDSEEKFFSIFFIDLAVMNNCLVGFSNVLILLLAFQLHDTK
jgi:hypothetical protein